MELEISRTHSMNFSAAGLRVRFFNLTTATRTGGLRGNSTAIIFSDRSRPPNRTIELGSKVTKCPVQRVCSRGGWTKW